MGQLLSYLKTTRAVDAEPLEPKPVLLFPTKLPPILLDLPKPGGPEPINIANRAPPSEGSLMAPPPRAITVGQRWPSYTGYTVALDAQTPARWSLKSAPADRIRFRSLGLRFVLRRGGHASALVADQAAPRIACPPWPGPARFDR